MTPYDCLEHSYLSFKNCAIRHLHLCLVNNGATTCIEHVEGSSRGNCRAKQSNPSILHNRCQKSLGETDEMVGLD